mmetsp:Transcript_90723/g.216578  ORF Transcript_90723/g.216578 Transcript_90723/m.216578 type:complete len:235 (+) Transcript_90723:116-820(+)
MPTPTPPQGMAARLWPFSLPRWASKACTMRLVLDCSMALEPILSSSLPEAEAGCFNVWLAIRGERSLVLTDFLELMADRGPLKSCVPSSSYVSSISTSSAMSARRKDSPPGPIFFGDFTRLVVWVCECVCECEWVVVWECVCLVTTLVLTKGLPSFPTSCPSSAGASTNCPSSASGSSDASFTFRALAADKEGVFAALAMTMDFSRVMSISPSFTVSATEGFREKLAPSEGTEA